MRRLAVVLAVGAVVLTTESPPAAVAEPTTFTAGVSQPATEYGDSNLAYVSGLDVDGPAPATGVVTFTTTGDGGRTLCTADLPVVACELPVDLPPDAYVVTATYSGDADHDGGTATTDLEVDRRMARLDADVLDDSVEQGTSALLTWAGLVGIGVGTEAASGAVTFTDEQGDVLCTATLPASWCATAPDLPLGTDEVTATYAGDRYFAPAQNFTEFTVVPRTATTFVAIATPTVVPYGSTSTVGVEGLDTGATGVVTFTAGTRVLCTATLPQTSCTTPDDLDAFPFQVVAQYGGDADHPPASDVTGLVVTKLPTHLTVSAAPRSTGYGQPVRLTAGGLATTGPLAAFGHVTFTAAGTTLCVALLPDDACDAPADLDAGRYPVTATYEGDGDHEPAAATTAFVVLRARTQLDATASAGVVHLGDRAALTASGLPADATGRLRFTARGALLCSVQLPATSCRTRPLRHVGRYRVTATYTGDRDHAAATATTRFTVR